MTDGPLAAHDSVAAQRRRRHLWLVAGAAAGGGAVVSVAEYWSDPSIVGGLVLGVAFAVAYVALAIMSGRRQTYAEAAAWVGLLSAPGIVEVRSRADVLTGALDAVSLAKGVVPALCLCAAWVIVVPKRPRATWLLGALAAYLAIVGLSTGWSVNPQSTALKAANLATGYALVITLVAYAGNDAARRAGAVAQLLVLIWLAEAAILPGQGLQQISSVDPTLRLVGLFPANNPNALGTTAVIAFLYVAIRATPRFVASSAAWTVGLQVLDIAALALTRTRSAAIILAVALGYLAIAERRFRRPATVVLTALGAAVIGLAISSPDATVSFFTRGLDETSVLTLTGRTQTWGDSIDQWLTSPVTGFGYYSGHRLGLQLPLGAPEVDTVDSMWIETALDLGILGLVPLAAFISIGAWHTFGRQGRRRYSDPLTRVMFLVGFATSAINPSLQTVGYVMAFFAVAILASGVEAPVGSDLACRQRAEKGVKIGMEPVEREM